MAMEPYSLFKNDVFIRYIIDKPSLYINNSIIVELEDVFPIRVILSEKHWIPSYADKMTDMNEYTYDNLKHMFAISKENKKLVESLPEGSILRNIITQSFPINHIISRELCILYFLKLYFYIVKNKDGSIKPFILISKYHLARLKQIYAEYKKTFPNIKCLYESSAKI